MRLQQLRDLVSVVQHGGFRAAALATGVTQGGLSKSIAKLEEDLGIALLERHPDGPVLTPEGEAFLSHARAILLETERADEWLAGIKSGKAQSISLGLSIEPSLQLAPKVLGHFRKAHPGVTVNLSQSVTTRLLTALRENRIDIALTLVPSDLDASDLAVDVIYETEQAIVGRKGHPCADARTLSEIALCDWMVVAGHTEEEMGIKQLFGEAGLGVPRIAVVAESIFPVVLALLESDSLACLPLNIVTHPLMRPHLVRLPVQHPARPCRVAVVRKKSRRLSVEAETLIAMLSSFARILYPMARE